MKKKYQATSLIPFNKLKFTMNLQSPGPRIPSSVNIEKAFLSLAETATWQNLITFPHSAGAIGGMLKVGRAELFFPKAETQGWSSKRSTKLSLIHLTTLAQCISNTWRKPRRHFWPKSMAYTRYKFIFLVVSLSVIGS